MLKSPFIVTISGDPLAGKSSTIEALTQKYEQEGFFIGENDEGKCVIRLAAGKIFRDIATHAGIELQVLNDFAKKPNNTIKQLKDISTDPSFFDNMSNEILEKSVDAFIDEYMLNYIDMLTTKYNGKSDVIILVDSRIAGLLMKRLGKENMAVRFSIKPEIAAERLLKDAQNRKNEISLDNITDEKAYDSALASVKLRTAKERERFVKTYSRNVFNQEENAKVDLRNWDNYNLIINTSGVAVGTVVETLYSCIEKARHGIEYNKFWLSSKFIYPGCVTNQDIGFQDNSVASVIEVRGDVFVIQGQSCIGEGNKRGYTFEKENGSEAEYPLIPVSIVAKEDQLVFLSNKDGNMQGIPADLYVNTFISREFLMSFAHDYGFEYSKEVLEKFPSFKEHGKNNKQKHKIEPNVEQCY